MPEACLWQASRVNCVLGEHERGTCDNGSKKCVDFNHWHKMETKGGQLVDADVAPLVGGKSSDIAKSNTGFWVVLREIPSTWSKRIKEFHNQPR
jgi:hypothetical protein